MHTSNQAVEKVLSLHEPNRLRHQIMVTVNKMDEWIVRAGALRSGGFRNYMARGEWSCARMTR